MTLNWHTLLTRGVDEAYASQHEAEEERKFYSLRRTLLLQYREKNETKQPSLQPTGWDDTPWRVWIPPYNAACFDGDNIVGPFGDTYFKTLAEATTFLKNVLDTIAANEEPEPQPEGSVRVRFKIGADVRSWTEFELTDATPQEVAILTSENDNSVELARQLFEAGRLIENSTAHDDNPDIFDVRHADSALLDVEVITKEGEG